MKLRASRNFFFVAVVVLVASCSTEESAEQQVRAVIAHAEERAEARDVSDLAALVSADYSDARGFDKKELTNYLRGWLVLHPSVNLLVRIESLEFPANNLARAEITVGMLGSRRKSRRSPAETEPESATAPSSNCSASLSSATTPGSVQRCLEANFADGEESWEMAAELETLEVELLNEDGEWRVIRADRSRD
jgi:hypothetical protein